MEWITKGFDGFSKGTMGNGGQNLYVSKKGVLQRIFQYDINQDGYPDLLFGNSQSMDERPPLYVYNKPLEDQTPLQLPTSGSYTGCLADLHGTGYQDLIVACQNDGQHTDITSVVYFGSDIGLSEKYKMELPAPNARAVCAGDFNGDGKMEIVFVSDGKLRMFFQRERGFCPADFVDYDFGAENVAAADFDGDGICDLVVKNSMGEAAIIYGTPNGLDIDHVQWLEIKDKIATVDVKRTTVSAAVGITAWRPCVVTINGVQYLFIRDGNIAKFITCNAERHITVAKSINCPGVVYAVAGDLNDDQFDELVLAVFIDRDEEADCRIYLGSETGITEAYETFSVKGCVSATLTNLDGKKIIFCRSGERIVREVPSPIVALNAQGKPEVVASLMGGNCAVALAGRPEGGEGNDTVIMVNHMRNRDGGHEDAYIYLGGEDGYNPDRKMCFPGHSSVGGAMVDFFDSGHVDVLLENCFEDSAYMDDGSYIYVNDGTNHFPPEKMVRIPTVRGHGVAIGDFNHDGYLDVASGGFRNREFRIFYGSENGFSKENCKKIVFGPDEEGYVPPKYEKDVTFVLDPKEAELTEEFGEVRWIMAADLNGDGWLDIIVSQICGTCCYILWGGPEGYSKDRMQTLYTDGVASPCVVDLDGDGYPDLILAQHQSVKKKEPCESYLTIYWGGPEGFKENRKTQLPVTCANACTVGDYSGQGKLDLYAVAYHTSRHRDILSHLYLNDGKGNFSVNRVQYLFNHSASGCVSGDFNGDGYTDLAIACHKEYGNHVSHSFIFWGGPDGLNESRKTVLPTIGPHGMCTVDPGNIMDRGPKEYYMSEIKCLPEGTKVQSVTWEGYCTSTSWVELEIRCAEKESEIEGAEWRQVECGSDITNMGISGAVQYRVALCAKCSCGTPRIESVSVKYE